MTKSIEPVPDDRITGLASMAEAFLFREGEPILLTRLEKMLNCNSVDLSTALNKLSERQLGSGLCLIRTDTEVSLAVSVNCMPAIRDENKKELEREIGDAGLEVLSILLYRGASTRAEIDYIRGVNTSSTLRNLLARNLISRTGNPNDAREYIYRPTVELLSHLGVAGVGNLPDYEQISHELKEFENKGDVDNN